MKITSVVLTLALNHHVRLVALNTVLSSEANCHCFFFRDAQRLEVFHSRTQQLKEHNKTLQDAIILLEER